MTNKIIMTNKKNLMTSEIRLINARGLSVSVGGILAMSKKLEKPQAQITHIMGENPTRNIGNKIARQIEEAFSKEEGWLDNIHLDDDEALESLKNVSELSKEAFNVAKEFQGLNFAQKAAVKQTIKAFSNGSL